MSESINFDELVELRQANVRAASYRLKRIAAGKFSISNEGKAIIGYNAGKGVNVKHGNGIVVIATLPKDDKRCTKGLLNGAEGLIFTSSEFERILEDNNLLGKTYEFEFVQEYQGLNYYKLVIAKPLSDDKDDSIEHPDDATEAEEPAIAQAPQSNIPAPAPVPVQDAVENEEF